MGVCPINHWIAAGVAGIFSLLLPVQAYAQSLPQGCDETLTDAPPAYLVTASTQKSESFHLEKDYVLEGQGKVSGQPAFDSADFGATMEGLIERGTLVSPLFDEADLPTQPSLVPIRVVSLGAPRMQKWRTLPTVQVGNTGFIDPSVLTPFGKDHVLLVRKDAILARFPAMTDASLAAGSILEPRMKDGKFSVLECNNPAGGKPLRSYLFAAKRTGWSYFAEKLVFALPENLSCMNLTGITLPQLESLQDVAKTVAKVYPDHDPLLIQDLEVNDWGLVKLPMRPTNDGTDITERALDGSFVHYQGTDPVGSDTWVQPHSACAFMKIAKEWKNKVCPLKNKDECAIDVGDISFATPGTVVGKKSDPLGHLFHATGLCFDVRAFRKDRKLWPLNVVNAPQDYDRSLTQDLIEFLLKKRATPIYFNDPGIVLNPALGEGQAKQCNLDDSLSDRGNKVQPCPGHDNHIHFCLLPEETEGC